MEFVLIALLVLLGVFLVVAEVLFLPGLSVAAFGSVVVFIVAIVLSYNTMGTAFAGFVFLGSFTLTIIALAFSLRAKTLKKISLEHTVPSTAAEDISLSVSVGEEGCAITRLGPIGMVEINGGSYQARSRCELIAPGSSVKVLYIEDNTVVVDRVE